jgi:magnesium-transporting ATPase (P-type)
MVNLNQKVMKKAADLVVGDILEVGSGEDIPADCIFLASL